MAQFKIYKCLRFRKKLAIDMADEYFKSGDHGKALTYVFLFIIISFKSILIDVTYCLVFIH